MFGFSGQNVVHRVFILNKGWALGTVIVFVELLPVFFVEPYRPFLSSYLKLAGAALLVVCFAELVVMNVELRQALRKLSTECAAFEERNEALWRKTLRLKRLLEEQRRFVRDDLDKTVPSFPSLTPAEWKFVLKNVHPDKHGNDPVATSVTRKILEHVQNLR